MVAVLVGAVAGKRKAGHLLLAFGGIALILQLWVLWLETSSAWSHHAAEALGCPSAFAIAMLQVVDFLAWNPNGILLSFARVLLLCWPMALMLAGVALSRGGN